MKSFITLLVVVAGMGQCFAQNTDWVKSPNPKMLSISTEMIRPGQEDAHQKTESGWRRAFDKAKFPSYFIGLSSLTGPSSMLFLTGYDSLAGMQKEDEAQSSIPWLWAEQDKLSIEDSVYVSSKNHEYAELQSELSIAPAFSLGAARSFAVTRIEVDTARNAEFRTWLKSQVRPGVPHLATYRVIAGGPMSTYVLIEARTSLAEFDTHALPLTGDVPGAKSILRNFYAPDPSTSRLTPEFTKGNEKFWNPEN